MQLPLKPFFFISLFLFHLSTQPLFGQFTVKADTLRGLTTERTVRMKQAMELWQQVMRDTAFQQELRSLRYSFDVSGDQNRFLSSEEIAAKIYQASEFYKDSADQCAQLHWLLDEAKKPLLTRRPAIGYGEDGDVEIHTYTWFFDSADLPELAGHIAHEWSHKIGFQHLYVRHKNRDKTVPYAFGNLVKKYAARW
jgi:uncharacterized protein YjaZ